MNFIVYCLSVKHKDVTGVLGLFEFIQVDPGNNPLISNHQHFHLFKHKLENASKKLRYELNYPIGEPILLFVGRLGC